MSINRKLAIHIFIKGRVQGVSFCYFTLKQAQNLNTEGWVRNNPKGNGEAFAQGDIFTTGAILLSGGRNETYLGTCRKGLFRFSLIR